MSYWVYLEEEGEPVSVDCHMEGGTYACGGMDTAELNITYNYSRHFTKVLLNGLKSLDGKHAKDVIKKLKKAVKKLGTTQDSDYWKPTAGNAGFALNILLTWAIDNPDAIFRVS